MTPNRAATAPASDQRGEALDRPAFVRPIAHRGLHDPAKRRIENSAPAFLAAIDKGYGIECDLQAAADGTPMVFHDSTLDRLVAASGPIAVQNAAALARLRYKGQDATILTFNQLLELVGGRVPLLVEVKSNGRPPPKNFLDEIALQAAAYRGPIALMSFDAGMVTRFAALAPAIPRGLVVGGHQLPANWLARAHEADTGDALSRLLQAAPSGLSFLAVEVRLLPQASPWMQRQPVKLPLFTWTVRTAQDRAAAERWADAPIFEGYEP